jgi:hypothetical protein
VEGSPISHITFALFSDADLSVFIGALRSRGAPPAS